MKQASMLGGLPFGARTLGENVWAATEIDLGGRQVVEALVATAVGSSLET